MSEDNREMRQKAWYRAYYAKAGKDRNNLRDNPGVLFQTLAAEQAFFNACRQINHNPPEANVLDVGCGAGADIAQLIRIGYVPSKITGIDIQEERLETARKIYGGVRILNSDATSMQFEDNSFDLVFESTMFATLPIDAERIAIASEMIRVCKPGGYLLLVDWRTPKPGDKNYKALTRARMASLFKLGEKTELITVCRRALVPPVGRFLSAYLPSIYFLVAAVFPFLVGQVAYVLRKRDRGGVER